MMAEVSSFSKRFLFPKRAPNGRSTMGQAVKPVCLEQMKMMKIFAVVLLSVPVLGMVTMVLNGNGSASDETSSGYVDASDRTIERTPMRNTTSTSSISDTEGETLELKSERQSEDTHLLPSGFDSESCISRWKSALYRKRSPFRPSAYLISKLRRYEDLHKRCGPNTKSYITALESLKPGQKSRFETGDNQCNYIVWVAYSGLGNRILTITSTFLYALLTNRVLLVEHCAKSDIADLFCEPFPQTTWLLPENFPVKNRFENLTHGSPECFGELLRRNEFKNGSLGSGFVYIDIVHDYNDHDKMFFCDEDHSLVANVKWLILRSDNYFIPSLFLMNMFQDELAKMFPQKSTVFHHLGQYLFHPTNQVWGLVTRFYDAYLASADERVGVQVRTFYSGPGPFQFVMEQIQGCIMQENLIPRILDDPKSIPRSMKTKAVLVTSLISDYSEKLRAKYWLNPTENNEVIGVYQPSHEGMQLTDQSQMHNRKAWAEMYLLSLMDTLVTSAWSTFGYVAQGLGGMRPFVLYKSDNQTVMNPPCGRAMSFEPCFHAPPFYDCRLRRGADTGAIIEHVKHCEDVSWGLKLVDPEIL